MSLVRLLAAGKSLETISDANRYKLPEQATLPRLERTQMLPAGPEKVSADDRQVGPLFGGPDVMPKPVSHVSTAAAAAPRQRWFTGQRRSATMAWQRQVMVQRELAMDGIKVMRNDLAEDDLGLVEESSRKATPTTGPKPGQDRGMDLRNVPFWRRWPQQVIHRARGWIA